MQAMIISPPPQAQVVPVTLRGYLYPFFQGAFAVVAAGRGDTDSLDAETASYIATAVPEGGISQLRLPGF